jgi:RimJ/RimL family protein N-acetyltransferase
MSEVFTAPPVAPALLPFLPEHAAAIATWAQDPAEMRWLAPQTRPPLDAEKVMAWQSSPGRAYVYAVSALDPPMAYAELNAFANDPAHCWIGHFVVRPDQRGRGIGRKFVSALCDEAFQRLRARKVALIVFPDNERAIHCYLRGGFTLIGEEWHSFLNGPLERLLRFEALPRPRP